MLRKSENTIKTAKTWREFKERLLAGSAQLDRQDSFGKKVYEDVLMEWLELQSLTVKHLPM